MKRQKFIPFHRPSIGEEEIEEVVATLRSGWLTSGPKTAAFEREFAAYVQASHALAVNSCTAGLHLALCALNIGPGDEVITTPLTFCATVNAILHAGAEPVLADIGGDGNIDPESAAKRLTRRTRAIIPVHLAGLACEMEPIWRAAADCGLSVIEDAAHAVGSSYRGAPIGASAGVDGLRSAAVAFSFYATKNLTTGEGGMVTTHDASLAARMKSLCLHGISANAWSRYSGKGDWFYEVMENGFKYNLSDLQSAIGIHQLRKQEQFIAIRTSYANRYRQLLGDVAELELPEDRSWARHAWHLFIIRLNLEALEIDRAAFVAALHQAGVAASVHFIPIPAHPAFARHQGLSEALCPRAMALYPRLISLPLYPAMTEEDVAFVARAVKEVIHSSTKRKRTAAGVGAASNESPSVS